MKAAARALATLAVLALVWLALDVEAATARLREADLALVVLAVVLHHVQIAAGAMRWRLTARTLGQPMSCGRAIRECYWAMLGNLSLPGGVLGDVARAVRSREAVGLGQAALAVALERLAGQIMLIGLLIASLALWPSEARWALLGAVGLAGGLALAAAAALGVARFGPSWAARPVVAARRCWFGRTTWRGQAATGAVATLAGVAAFVASSAAIGAPLGWTQIAVAPIAMLAMLAPFSVGGWGWREGAAAMLWPLAGHDAAAGFAASIVYGVSALAAAAAAPLLPARRVA